MMINFDAAHPGDYMKCGKIDLPWHQVDGDLCSVSNEQSGNGSIIDNYTYDDAASAIQNEYKRYGYTIHNTKSWKTTNLEEKITFDWEKIILDHLPLEHGICAVTRQDPGQVLPWHYDRFFMLKNLYPDDPRPIWRFLMFLEDWKIGHFLQVGDSVLHHWHRGDVVVWRPGTMHLSCNVGFEQKWTCNITGFLTHD